MSIAKFLSKSETKPPAAERGILTFLPALSYALSPLICFAVVGSLKGVRSCNAKS